MASLEEALERLEEGSIEVTLKSVSLSPNDVKQLATALRKYSQQVEILSLFFCQIDDKSFHLLCEALQECAALEKLDLVNTLLADASLEDLFNCALERKPRLLALNLHSNYMTDRSCRTLVHHLPQWPLLRTLTLSNNEITETGATLLCTAMNNNKALVEVAVGSNEIPNTLKSQLRAACYSNAVQLTLAQAEQITKLKRRNADLERKCNELLTQQFSRDVSQQQPRAEDERPRATSSARLVHRNEEEWEDERDFVNTRKQDLAQQQRSYTNASSPPSQQPSKAEMNSFNNRMAALSTTTNSNSWEDKLLPAQQQPQRRRFVFEQDQDGGEEEETLYTRERMPMRRPPQQQQQQAVGVVASSPLKRIPHPPSSPSQRREPSPTRMPPLSPGQWKCSECLYNNAGSRQACLSCLNPRTNTSQQVVGVVWTCSSCTFENKRNSYICEICNARKL